MLRDTLVGANLHNSPETARPGKVWKVVADCASAPRQNQQYPIENKELARFVSGLPSIRITSYSPSTDCTAMTSLGFYSEEDRRNKVQELWRNMVRATEEDQKSIVPILAAQGRAMSHDRTGVLIAIADMHFVFTAAHNLLESADSNISFYMPGTPDESAIPLSGQVFADPRSDLAIIELEQSTIESLPPARRFVRCHEIDRTTRRFPGAYVIRGYPTEFGRTASESRRIYVKTLRYVAQLHRGELPGLLDGPYDSETHLLLTHVKHGWDGDGEPTRPPRIQGMSGGGVWRLCTSPQDGFDDDWNAQNRPLVAIQTACKPGNYFRATWIVHGLKVLAGRYPDLRHVMQHLYVPN